MNPPEAHPVNIDKQLNIFIGHADDADQEALLLFSIEGELKNEFENKPHFKFETIKFWEHKKDLSCMVGNQHTLIEPQLEKSLIAVFVFKDRIGDVTWSELQSFLQLSQPRWVITLFRKKPSDEKKLNDPNYINEWSTLLNRKRELTLKWDVEGTTNVRQVEEYTSPNHLKLIALDYLRKSITEIQEKDPATIVKENPTDTYAYLTALFNECKSIDIRGVKVSDRQAHRLDIEKIYTPLYITGSADDIHEKSDKKEPKQSQLPEKVNLDEILKNQATIIIGDPGAGKSTFLKHIVFTLCRTLLSKDPEASRKLGLDPAPFPVLVRLFDLSIHIKQCLATKECRKRNHTK
jgi:hypothetical protein